MMNPLHIQTRKSTDQASLAAEEQPRKTSFTDWIVHRFKPEHPHRRGENFFISDVTDGGIGSHHHHQLYRADKRH